MVKKKKDYFTNDLCEKQGSTLKYMGEWHNNNNSNNCIFKENKNIFINKHLYHGTSLIMLKCKKKKKKIGHKTWPISMYCYISNPGHLEENCKNYY